MKLLVLGSRTQAGVELVKELLLQLQPEELLFLRRDGLTRALLQQGVGKHIKQRFFPPQRNKLPGPAAAVAVAAENAALWGQPDLAVVISPRHTDDDAIKVLRRYGIRVIRGVFNTGRSIFWTTVA